MKRDLNAVERSGKPCRFCNEPHYSLSYTKCPELTIMHQMGVCYICAYWELKAQQPQTLVIAHRIYSIGKNGQHAPKQFKGMGGRQFEIEFFDGKRMTIDDLWGGAEVPPRWRERIPNTARFLNGAGAETINGITYFNPSRSA